MQTPSDERSQPPASTGRTTSQRKRTKRPKRSELTTATAQAERREPLPVQYNPLEQVAPVQPTASDAVARFRFDEFVDQRRYRRANPNGPSESRLDADQWRATPAYEQRLLSQPLDQYIAEDPLIDEEREAAYVEQPPEAIAQFRNDLHNPRLLALAKRGHMQSASPSSQLALQRQLANAPRNIQRQTADRLLGAFANADTTRNASTLQADKSPQAAKYDGPDPDNLFDRQEVLSDGPENNAHVRYDADLFIKKNIEAELNDLDAIDDEDEENGTDNACLRRELLAELAEVEARIASREESDDMSDSSEASSSTAQENGPNRSRSTVAAVGDMEARDLLQTNALIMLPAGMRSQFMQLAEASLIWQLLQPLILQHEEHKRHYNLVELVRAMALCGAKYAGLAHVGSELPLRELVDKKFYASFLDKKSGELLGGHEHCCTDGGAAKTRFVVLKFYCVRRNKSNAAAIDGADFAESGATTGKAADRHMSRLLDRTDINEKVDARNKHTQLHREGLYDVDNRIEDAEDDGTDEYSTLHDIRYLDREFMFCMRLVCVEAVDVDDGPVEPCYASEDEDEDVQLPPELALAAEEERRDRAAATHVSIVGSEADNFSSTIDLDTDRSSHMYTDSVSTTSSAPTRSYAAECHSDDDERENEHDMQQHTVLAATADYMPSNTLHTTLDDAKHHVGKWQAPRFMQIINSHFLAPLCVRSFLFYVNDTMRK